MGVMFDLVVWRLGRLGVTPVDPVAPLRSDIPGAGASNGGFGGPGAIGTLPLRYETVPVLPGVPTEELGDAESFAVETGTTG